MGRGRRASVRWATGAVALWLGLAFATPAAAQWLKIGPVKDSMWFVADRAVAVKGDCRTILAMEVHRLPQEHALGRFRAKRWIMIFCCRKNTFRAYGVTFYGLDGKPFHAIKFPPRVRDKTRTPGKGTVFARIMTRVCAKNYRLVPPDRTPSPDKRPAPPRRTGPASETAPTPSSVRRGR